MALPRLIGSSAFLSRDAVKIPAGSVTLEGLLELPLAPGGLVLLISASGGSRAPASDVFASRRFHKAGLGSLIVDLLTREEESQTSLRFDVGLLAERLKGVTAWASDTEAGKRLQLGYYGFSAGAAAALRASGDAGSRLGAIVSRGGRADLAREALPRIQVPTLLLVGERDETTLDLNRQAFGGLRGEKRLVAIPNAGPFFDEPGALEEATRLASSWFEVYLTLGAA